MTNQTWQEYLTHYFNQSVDKADKEMTIKEMVDNYLAMVEHALQHEDASVKFTSIDGQRCLYTKTGNEEVFTMPVEELKVLGYNPESLQSAADFIADNWNWY